MSVTPLPAQWLPGTSADRTAAVDGLLGIGRARPIEADLVSVLAALGGAPRRPRIVALDVPTGVDADSGRVDAAALSAIEPVHYLKQ